MILNTSYQKLPKELDTTLTILHTQGEEGLHKVSELENLFKLNFSKRLSQDLLQFMCKTTIAKNNMEEDKLLHRQKEA